MNLSTAPLPLWDGSLLAFGVSGTKAEGTNMRLWRGRHRYTLWLEERNAILTAHHEQITQWLNSAQLNQEQKVLHIIDENLIAKARLLANDRAFSLNGHIQENPMS